MIYALVDDDNELVGLIANLEWNTVQEAVRKVDEAFRRVLDHFPDVEEALCADLGIAYASTMTDWRDVLMAYLVECGGTEVEYQTVDAVPDHAKLGVD